MNYYATFGSVYPEIYDSSFPELAHLPLDGDESDLSIPEQKLAYDTSYSCQVLLSTVSSKVWEVIEPGQDSDRIYHELLAKAPDLVQEAAKLLDELYEAYVLYDQFRKAQTAKIVLALCAQGCINTAPMETLNQEHKKQRKQRKQFYDL